jgi:predicted metal-dependent phosphoesterase TrpH
VDLHSHSISSDGSVSAEDIVRRAHASNIQVIAITDHDQVTDHAEARALSKSLGVELIEGIEMSCELSMDGKASKAHLLGYFFDRSNKQLNAAVTEIQTARTQRNQKIIDSLNNKGVLVKYEDVMK